jgi:hypothetical protein
VQDEEMFWILSILFSTALEKSVWISSSMLEFFNVWKLREALWSAVATIGRHRFYSQRAA